MVVIIVFKVGDIVIAKHNDYGNYSDHHLCHEVSGCWCYKPGDRGVVYRTSRNWSIDIKFKDNIRKTGCDGGNFELYKGTSYIVSEV
jgi:hypothetical protein